MLKVPQAKLKPLRTHSHISIQSVCHGEINGSSPEYSLLGTEILRVASNRHTGARWELGFLGPFSFDTIHRQPHTSTVFQSWYLRDTGPQ